MRDDRVRQLATADEIAKNTKVLIFVLAYLITKASKYCYSGPIDGAIKWLQDKKQTVGATHSRPQKSWMVNRVKCSVITAA